MLALVGMPRIHVKYLTELVSAVDLSFIRKLNKILQGYLLPPTDHSWYYRQKQLREYFHNFQGLIFPPDTGHDMIWILFAFYISLLSHEKKMMLEIQIAFLKFLSLQSFLISWGLVGWLVLVFCVMMTGE